MEKGEKTTQYNAPVNAGVQAFSSEKMVIPVSCHLRPMENTQNICSSCRMEGI